MTLALVLSLLSGQVIYEWVDAKGQSHFTNDRGTIPDGVKVRETAGAEVSVVEASPPPAADAGVEEGEETAEGEVDARDSCAVARSELARALEKETQATQSQAQLEQQLTLQCGQKLLTHGQGSFAQCMAARSEAITRNESAVKQQVEVARETLRIAEAQGCR